MAQELSSTPSLAAAWPLIGREGELERMAQARADHECRGVVVGALAGAGKSRLAREACAIAERSGALVDWVQATSSAAAVPLGAFAGLLPDDVRTDDTLELMRRSVDSLQARAAGRAVVLGVDDAQLLDPVSAALVLHLTVTESAFVVATVRTGEPCPDAIVSLWKDAGARRVELGRLSDDAVSAMVEAALGGPVEQGALRWLCDSSQGNALYVRELVLGAVASQTLTHARGLWRTSSHPPMSHTLAELVAERMSGLSDTDRAPLELLALGEPLRLDELVALTGYESLVASEAHGLVSVSTPALGAEVRIAHPLYGEVIRDGLPSLRARELRRLLAETVRRRDPLVPDDALRVARWLLDAGEAIDVGLLVDATVAANLAGDPELGAQLGELAVRDGAGMDGVLPLARAYRLRKRFEDAERVLAAAEGSAATPDEAFLYLEQRVIPVLFFGLNRPQAARDLLERARSWWPGQEWQRRLDSPRLSLASLIDGYNGPAEVLAEILADPELDDSARRAMEPLHAVSLFFTGQAKAGYEIARRIRPSVPLRDPVETRCLGIFNLVANETGEDWADLDTFMAQTMRDAVRANDHEAAGSAALSLACTLILGGRHLDATRWLAEAELHLEHQDAFGSLVIVRCQQTVVADAIGDVAGAATGLQRTLDTLDGRDALPHQRPQVVRARAAAAHAAGDFARAQRELLEGAEEMIDAAIYGALLTYDAMRAGAAATAIVVALNRFAQRCDARLTAAYAAHAGARATADGVALLAACGEFAEIGARRYAVEAATHAAEAFLADGRQDSARRAAARARELHVENQGGSLPAVDGLDSDAVALTAREAQLVALAARGMSNAEIADQLVLSVRTVETHIYRAMQKLGVSDRHDL